MRNRQYICVLLCLVVLITCVNSVHSGECKWGAEFYLTCLEGHNQNSSDCPDPYKSFSCVGIIRKELDRWASDREAKRILEFRNISYHDRLVGLAVAYLDDSTSSSDTKAVAVEVLAFQGIKTIQDYDVFEMLVKQSQWNMNFITWYVLAALGDARTVDFARQEYKRIRNQGAVRGVPPRPLLMELIDCLYHIPGDEAVELAHELAAGETDKALRDRLNHVAWKRSRKH